MKTRLSTIISLLLSVVLVLSVFAGCDPKKKETGPMTPFDYLEKIIEKTFTESEQKAENALASITFKPTEALPVPGLGELKVDSYAGTSGQSIVLMDMLYNEENIDLSIYAGGTSFIVSSSILGETKYGFGEEDLESILELLTGMLGGSSETMPTNEDLDYEGGAVAPVGGATQLYSTIMALMATLDGENADKLVSFNEKYLTLISKSVEDAVKSSVKTENNIEVAFELDNDGAKKIITDLFTALRNDKDLKAFVVELLAATGMDKTEAETEYDKLFSDESLNDAIASINEEQVTLVITFKADKNYILTGYGIKSTSDGSVSEALFDFADKNNIRIVSGGSDTYDGETYTYSEELLIKTVKSGDVSKTTVTQTNTYDGESESDELMSIETNAKTGEYTFTVYSTEYTDDYEEVTTTVSYSGKITETEDSTVLTVAEISADGKSVTVDLTLTVKTGVTLPSFPTDYKNILEVTNDEFNEIKEQIMNSPIGDILASIPGEDDGYDDDDIVDGDDFYELYYFMGAFNEDDGAYLTVNLEENTVTVDAEFESTVADGITLYQVVTEVGVISSYDGETVTAIYDRVGACASVEYYIEGDGAEEYIEAICETIKNSGNPYADKMIALYNGEPLILEYGDDEWEALGPGSSMVRVYSLDFENDTFVLVENN